MKSDRQCCHDLSKAFYGTATVGERGQIVIPAEARADIGFLPGDKVMFIRHPMHNGLMLFKIEAVREFMEEFAAGLARAEENKEEVE
jgi:AbrB family looped-hinge helix DNA binding protein